MKLTLRRPPKPATQAQFAFRDRVDRLDRRFKRSILGLSLLAIVAIPASSGVARRSLGSLADQARAGVLSWIGLEPQRAEIEDLKRRQRSRTAANTLDSLTRFYNETTPEMRRLFDVAGMDPVGGLVVTGRANHGYLLSSKVFERDEANGRSYRFRPSLRSVWLRQITLRNGPFGLFLVPDEPAVRAAAGAAGAIVDESTRQSTNSWGLRGPEPDPEAPIRGIVLGDSFMEGMFVGDDDTPPVQLERALCDIWKARVSILNTGHVGYAPEQYLASLLEYGPKFRPDFVVASVCPNDFGDGNEVLAGGGDDWDEASFNLNAIAQWCRAKNIPFVLVPVPVDPQLLGTRRDGRYPGRISDRFQAIPASYLNPFDEFLNEHLRLEPERRRGGVPSGQSALYNLRVADNHFSPIGCALWARLVAERLDLMSRDRRAPGSKRPPSAGAASTRSPASLGPPGP